MRQIIVNNMITLDGVMQAPGRPDEDVRGGFQRGGWAMPYNDEVKGRIMAEGMSKPCALLFGRRTYEDFYKVWPNRKGDPVSAVLDNTHKYVASTSLKEPLPWKNSTLLAGDAGDTVARLKQEPGDDLVVLGSGELIRALARRNLVDQYILCIHPLVMGTGRRLFADGGAFAALRLVNIVPTTTGVIIATYEPAESAPATAV